MKKIIRPKEAAKRLGGGLSTFHQKFVATGKIKAIHLGKRSTGFLESDVDRLIDELIRESETNPNRRALSPKTQKASS
jgi:predicted DNA-binding transcriptional regulator AlpA